MAQSNPMRLLYSRLAAMGATRSFVRDNILPSWWDDEAADDPAGLLEAHLLISRHLGVDLASLRSTNRTVTLSPLVPCKFKKTAQTTPDELKLARSLATQVAKFSTLGLKKKLTKMEGISALDIRAAVLRKGEPWVGFQALVDYCWKAGVPILHVSNFPRTTKKMDALSADVAGQPVIVISRDQKQPAWLLFILAHELGHICLGHVTHDQVLLDEQIDQEDLDDEESAANAFALSLLCGGIDSCHSIAVEDSMDAEQLADTAARHGRIHGVDPGHLVLNYAHRKGGGNVFRIANAALQILEPNPSALIWLRKKMAESLDWTKLPRDAAEFLSKMTQADPAAG
jgi:IrrE N-terminal-like domain